MLRLEDISKFVLNGKLEHFYISSALKKSDNLLKFRLWIYGLAFTHLVTIAIKLLSIDFTKAEDPSVWAYESAKWKLITCWFNLISLVYFPICIYCDYKELRKEANKPIVRRLNNFRFLVYTSILFPTTTLSQQFADVLFWRLWVKDRELIAPVAVDKIVPFWTQHSMHTVTLIFTLIDLVMVPRKRPRTFTQGISVMLIFLTAYFIVCVDSFSKGEYLYPILSMFSGTKLTVLALYVVIEHLFLYLGQFYVNDFLWGKTTKEVHTD